MKNMNIITQLFIGLGFLSLAITGCDNNNSGHLDDYKVTCTLANKSLHDSATLLVLEEDYGKLRVCGTALAKEGTFTFTGQTYGPKAAMIRWDNDSTQPFYFVLEGGHIKILIKDNAWDITGSPRNSEYLHYINQRNDIMNARVATWQEYLKMASDSSLKRDDERLMVRQDSLLNDSLQNLTVKRINRADAVGRIIRERYGSQLDQEHMRRLK